MKNIWLFFLFPLFLHQPLLATAHEIQVALTFDDLPAHGKISPSETRIKIASKIIGVLKKYKIHEVYGFINAAKIELHPEYMPVLTQWRKAGHLLGNHTYSHTDLYKTDVAEYESDIEKNEKILKELSGSFDWKYFRYPYLAEGDTLEKRNAIRQYLQDKNYKIAQISIYFDDYAWNTPYMHCLAKKNKKAIKELKKSYLKNAELALDQSDKVTQQLFKRPIKHVLLLHFGAFDAQMLDDLIKLYLKKGVKFIPLPEALSDEVYSLNPGVLGRWGSQFQLQVMTSRGLTLKDLGVEEIPYPVDELNKVCL